MNRIGNGGRETHVLETRFNTILPLETSNITVEVLSYLKLPTDGFYGDCSIRKAVVGTRCTITTKGVENDI